MKSRTIIFVLLLAVLSLNAAENKLIINADQAKYTISRHIYGHFAEHLGHCIYGGIWVGEDSDIPNINGYRKDIVEALQEIKIPNLRWPGGCFADTYHWQDGLGPKEGRPPILNYHWGNVIEDNSFGTHEFLNLCELLDCEPYLAVNVGTGSPKDLKDWVLYVNGEVGNPMANWRKENGREKPWKVRYWGIGNEVWGCGGSMTPDYYAPIYKHYATFCRTIGGTRPFKVACGPNGDDAIWTETLMRDVGPRQMQGISMHHYTVAHGNWRDKGSATDFEEADWFEQIDQTLHMEKIIQKNLAIMDYYDPEKRVGLIIDEWGNWFNVEPGTERGFLYQQNSLRDAMIAAINFNIFNNNCDRVQMCNIAQTVNVLQAVVLTKDDLMVKTPTWHVFKLFTAHHDAELLPSSVETVDYTFGEESVPAINASASRKEGVIHISLTNSDPNKAQSISCDIRGADVKSVSGEIITADAINAYNDFGKKENVFIKSFSNAKVRDGMVETILPPKSIVMLTLK